MFLFYVLCIYVWEIGEILNFYGRMTFLPALRSSWGLNIIANLPSFFPVKFPPKNDEIFGAKVALSFLPPFS